MSLSASVRSRLQHQHETIHDLLKGISSAQLKQRIQNDKWSIHEPVAHLASCQKPVSDILNDLQLQQYMIMDYLLAVPAETPGKTGRHPKYGQLTMTEWTEFFLSHEAHRLFSIFILSRAGTQ